MLCHNVKEELVAFGAQGAVAVQDKGDKGGAQGSGVGLVLAKFVLLATIHRSTRGEVTIGGRIEVDARDVKEDGLAGKVDHTVGEEIIKVLLDLMGDAAVGPRKVDDQLDHLVVAHVDGQTLEVGAREAVPEHIITHNTTTAEGADRRKVIEGRKTVA
jgi:hypothetical protein